MHPALSTGLAVALGVALLAGCGGSSPSTTPSTAAATIPATTGPAPAADRARARLGAALQRLQREPHHFRVVVRQRFAAAGAPPALQRALAALPTTTTVTAQVESPRRITSAATLPIGPKLARIRTVTYDGAWFISRDGTHWRRTSGALAGALAQATSIATTDLLAQLTDVREAGPATFAGVPARRYTGALDPKVVRRAVGAIFVRLGVDPGLLTIDGARAEYFVRRADGRVVGVRTTQRVALDLSRLPGGPEGTLVSTATSTARYSHQGDPVHVRRPSASGSVSTPAELVAFLSDG
ncbi:MAG: hypothetical protein QOK40_689 [Miltoncostaeaceae bacterium]|jgi:hypothetical protein|nr:hypothetical protein [Miltoncostaeaceae bacterium]